MENSRVIEVQRTLTTGGLTIRAMEPLPNGHGVQIHLVNGGIVNVFDTGTVDVQGQKTDLVKRVLGSLVVAPPIGDRECFVCLAGDDLQVHHLDGNHDNNSPGNRVDLCQRCHSALHTGDVVRATLDDLKRARAGIGAIRQCLGGGSAATEN